jgi:hypothetical protein
VEPAHDLRPRVAAVQAPEDAVDLDAGPHDARVVLVDEHSRDERLPDGAFGGCRHVEPLPRSSAVARAIDTGRPGSREDCLRIGGIDGQRPDRGQIAGGSDALPGRAAVVRREQARVAGGQDPRGSPGKTASAWMRLFSGKGLR